MAEQQGSGTATRATGSSDGVTTVSDPKSLAEPTNGATIKKKQKRPSRRSVVIGAVVLLLVAIAGGTRTSSTRTSTSQPTTRRSPASKFRSTHPPRAP